MNPWPKVALPDIQVQVPKLKLQATSGDLINRKFFNIYVCGITPYDATHLGHALTYLFFDVITRYQILANKQVNFIENVTDVDDPLFDRANRDGVNWETLAKVQISLFTRDMTALRIMPPRKFDLVSETVGLVIEGLQKLESKGLIYRLDTDLYLEISSFINELPIPYAEALEIFAQRGGDPNRLGKRDKLDPLLWRGKREGEPSWPSPFGDGRPGWHIECSVIALQQLNFSQIYDDAPVLDLQGGGSDLIFPHHFMTKIIAESMVDRDFAAAYVHVGLLGLDGEKMSKSRGNLVFVHKLLEEKWDAMEIRHALLDSHYREERMWRNEFLIDSRKRVHNLRIALAKSEVANTDAVIAEILQFLANDLNTVSALKALDKWAELSIAGAVGGNAGELSRFIDAALGLAL